MLLLRLRNPSPLLNVPYRQYGLLSKPLKSDDLTYKPILKPDALRSNLATLPKKRVSPPSLLCNNRFLPIHIFYRSRQRRFQAKSAAYAKTSYASTLLSQPPGNPFSSLSVGFHCRTRVPPPHPPQTTILQRPLRHWHGWPTSRTSYPFTFPLLYHIPRQYMALHLLYSTPSRYLFILLLRGPSPCTRKGPSHSVLSMGYFC